MHRARGFSSWSKRMVGGYATKASGMVAAAAALATAATSAGLTDRLHPIVVSPLLIYSASPGLLIPCASASAGSGGFSSLGPSSSLGTGASSNSVAPAMGFAFSSSGLGSSLSQSQFLSLEKLRRPISTVKDKGYLKSPSLPYPSPLFPSTLFSGLELRREDNIRPYKTSASNSISAISFTDLSSASSGDSVPLSDNFPPFDTSDLSSLLASFLVSPSHSSPPSRHPVTPSSRSLQRWHKPVPNSVSPGAENGTPQDTKPTLTVVLLGWLGSQQKHLKKYAEWYNARGIHAVTFTVPMTDLLSISMIGKVEGHVELLTNQLSAWLDSQGESCAERQLIFHTFSNAGWLTYGVVLEKLAQRGNDWAGRIKGCVIDSAPAADPDPRIWACGFSAAILKKRTNPAENKSFPRDAGLADSRHTVVISKEKSYVAESALHTLLEKFFLFFLRIPAVNERLGQVVTVLSKDQPPCPQLYMYSTGDKIIPASLVEAFMEKQKRQGHNVRGWDFQSSPHVDHFRTFPEVYSAQVTSFLKDCLQAS